MTTSQEVSQSAIYKVRGDQNAQQEWTQHVRVVDGFTPEEYDTIEMGYTSGDLTTMVYKLGGATVATVTLGYTGGELTSMVRS